MPKVGQRSALRSRLLRVFAGFDACDLPESAPAIGSQTFMRLPWGEAADRVIVFAAREVVTGSASLGSAPVTSGSTRTGASVGFLSAACRATVARAGTGSPAGCPAWATT